MKEYYTDIKNVEDSREIMFAKPPRIMRIFIFSILFMLIIGFLWMWFGRIDIVVKASGIVRPAETISIITNLVDGELKEKYYKNGDIVKKGVMLYSIDDRKFCREKESIESRKATCIRKQKQLRMLYKSIADDLQWFPEDDHEFYDRFVLYQLQTKQLTLDYNKAKSIFERESILPKGMVADIQIETLLSNYDYAKLALSKFKRETLVQLQNEINAIEEKLLSIDNSMNIVEENLRRCNIYASMSGILQESNTYHINDYLPSGIELSRIIPNEDAKLMTELFISNKDIALIMKGTTVNYRFAALPYDEYGSISGNIVEIPADISIRNTVNDFAYIVKASIDENAERNVKKSKDFRIGMLCEARIIVSEKRILTFVLEKLNFL